MALPKKRHSKARGKRRRTHWKLSQPNLMPCPQCKQPKVPHSICLVCGYYNGRQIVQIKVKEKKRKQ